MADETTILCDAALLPDGWAQSVRFLLRQGRIAAIERDVVPAIGEARHACVVPGLPNLHSHAFQRAMAGLAEVRGPDDDGFWTWRAVMYRFVNRLTADDLHAIAALAYVEMLESGFTRVGEFHYLHNDRDGHPNPSETSAAIARAADDTGMALTLLPVFYACSGFGGQPPLDSQRRFVTNLDGYALLLDGARRAVASLPDAVVGVAPHSLRAVAPQQLSPLVALAQDGPVHIHIAEQRREVEQCQQWSGRRPVEWLLDHMQVDARWCLVHATHLVPAEVAAIAASGAVAGLCPMTEANLGDGLFPAGAFLDAGGRFGIGSDSNVRIDATEELRLLEYGQRLVTRSRNCFARMPGGSTGEALFQGAVAGGAQALGARAGLAKGAPFDAVGLDTSHPSLRHRPPQAMLDGWIFAAGREAVDRVWRAGRCVVADGRHIARDAVVTSYDDLLRRLLA